MTEGEEMAIALFDESGEWKVVSAQPGDDTGDGRG
jgi:hypothetical protein